MKYEREHEIELLAILGCDPDWSSFLTEDIVGAFREALLEGETYLCEQQGIICGYIRAVVDGLGIYVSELYVAPAYRGSGYGVALLDKVRHAHPGKDVYVLSDEDSYYEKIGYRRVGSIYKL